MPERFQKRLETGLARLRKQYPHTKIDYETWGI